MKSPLVSISIPTLNSGSFIKTCLDAVQRQTYLNISINIVDGESTDDTLKKVKKYIDIDTIIYSGALLGARYEGLMISKGEYILLLDSDQVLESHTVARAVKLIEKDNLDMLVLEEGVYRRDTFIEKLFALDRNLIHRTQDMNPITGVVLPRFYKRSFLQEVFEVIPEELYEKVGGQDHAIIYYEAWKRSKKVAILPNSVKHIEPRTLFDVWRKFYRWGETSVDAHYGQYDKFLKRKEHFRSGLFRKGLYKESFASVLLLLLKGIPYKTGYYFAKIKR